MKLNLTEQQRSQLIYEYVRQVVNSMSREYLEKYVFDSMLNRYDSLSDKELEYEINVDELDTHFEDLVNKVCSEDKLTNVQC